MKILQTPVRFFTAIGGVENHVYYLSEELIKLGHSVKIICADDPSSKINNVFGIEVKRLKSWFKITNTNITPWLPIEILKSKYDIVHTHMPTPWTSDWSIFLSKLMGKKSVITIHNDMDKTSFLSKIITEVYLHTVFLLSLSLVDKIIIVNEEWEKSFSNTSGILKRFKDKIIFLPNGVDTNIFKPLDIPREKNTVLFVSILDRHHKFKGLNYLLEAIKLIKKTIPDIKLIIIGEGELKIKYKNLSKELEISENVKFLGEKNQKELVSYYNKASIFILPSIEIEGFGIVLLEALACKTPIVATDIVGLSNGITKSKSGLIVKKRDKKSLVNAIEYILENKVIAKNMGENGRRLVESKYDWKSISEQVVSIYQGVIS